MRRKEFFPAKTEYFSCTRRKKNRNKLFDSAHAACTFLKLIDYVMNQRGFNRVNEAQRPKLTRDITSLFMALFETLYLHDIISSYIHSSSLVLV